MRTSKLQKLSHVEKADFDELETKLKSNNPYDRVEAVLSEKIPWRTLLEAIKAEIDPIVLNEFAIYSAKQYPSVQEAYIANDAVDVPSIWLFLCNPKVKVSRSVIEKIVTKAEKMENGLADVAHAIGLQENAWPKLLENFIDNYAHSMETVSNLLANPNMPPHVISQYQDSDEVRILLSIAYNTSTPDEVFIHILNRDGIDSDVIEGIIWNSSVSYSTFENCLFASPMVSDSLAEYSDSVKILQKLADADVDRINAKLLNNTSTPTSIIKKIALKGNFTNEVFRHKNATSAIKDLLDVNKIDPVEFRYVDCTLFTKKFIRKLLNAENVEIAMRVIVYEGLVSVEDTLKIFERVKGHEYDNFTDDTSSVKKQLLDKRYPDVKKIALKKYGISLEEIPKEMVPDLLGWP
jgi:hypothetical protein